MTPDHQSDNRPVCNLVQFSQHLIVVGADRVGGVPEPTWIVVSRGGQIGEDEPGRAHCEGPEYVTVKRRSGTFLGVAFCRVNSDPQGEQSIVIPPAGEGIPMEWLRFSRVDIGFRESVRRRGRPIKKFVLLYRSASEG